MSILERIIAYKRDDVAQRKTFRPLAEIERTAMACSPPRDFLAQLRNVTDRPALIAEIKKASPSKGLIRHDFDPAALARAYEAGGAACLSVLTDAPSFQGADAHLAIARDVCTLPVLRKDFTIDPWQVFEARTIGADAVLIIMAATGIALARDLYAAANACGLTTLVEVHDDVEMDEALELGAPLIGVNNRSLATFDIDLSITARLARLVPPNRLLVAESGISTSADIDRLTQAGANAFLVGESLMRQPDVAEATRRLLSR